MTTTTTVWGVIADAAGLIHKSRVMSEELVGGGIRVWSRHTYDRDQTNDYASSHPAPMPMRWGHKDEIGRVVALRRQHDRLYAIAECDLEPDELDWLTGEYGDLRWSTGTEGRRDEALRIVEISLTPKPATVGLPAVRWHCHDVTKGDPPMWVREDLARARKTEFRSRGQLVVHDASPAPTMSAAQEYDQIGRDLGMIPGGEIRRYDPRTGETYEVLTRPGRIIGVR